MLKDGLSTLLFDDEITICWNRLCKHSENDCYCIYLNNNLVATTQKTHYEFLNLIPETKYEIMVTLKNDKKEILVGKDIYITKKRLERIDVTKPPYNAIPDGKTVNTDILQKALDECGENRCIYFPEGQYLTGALNVHSNTEIFLSYGAVIQGTDNLDDYLPFIKSRSEGLSMMCYRSLINMGELDEKKVYNCENVVIRGGGSIVGGGTSLCNKVKEYGQILLKDYIDSLGEEIKDFECGPLTIAGRLRGRLVNMSNCKNIVLSNIHFQNGPYWNIHFIYSDNIVTKSCEIVSYSVANGDGWNPDSSTNCSCFNTVFNCGDNCVAIKSGKNPDGNRINRPTENINIFDCKIMGGSGFVIGSEMSGGVKDVTMWNIDGENGNIGVKLKTTRKRGGYIKNIKVYDSIMPCFNIETAVVYNNDGISSNSLCEISDVLCENVIFTGRGHCICRAGKLDDVNIVNVPVITIKGFQDRHDLLSDVTLKNCSVKKAENEDGHTIIIDNFNAVSIQNLKTID